MGVMEFSGIREAYDYPTPEGWHVILTSYSEEEFRDWLDANPPDLWISDYELEDDRDILNHPGNLFLVFKDRLRYLAFRVRWQSTKEYVVCHDREVTLSSLASHLTPWKVNWQYDLSRH